MQKTPRGTNWGVLSIRTVLVLIVCVLIFPITATANKDASSNSSKNVVSQRSMSSKSAKKDSVQASTSSFNFRKTSWGMTPAEVRASESATFGEYSEKLGMMIFSGQVAGMSAQISYIFSDDKLIAGGYHFEEKHTNPNKHLDDFSTLKAMMKQKYGTPQIDKSTWSSDLFKDNPQLWGMAVQMGYLTQNTLWQTASTSIEMVLTGDNLNVTLGTLYVQTGQFDVFQQRIRNTHASDF